MTTTEEDKIVVEASKATEEKCNLVILFAYNGTNFQGLERIKNGPTADESVEQALFKAFKDAVSLTHISRASLTAPGEHASKQVISLSYTGSRIPSVEEVNELLPKDIRVFKIHKVERDFSARRTCEARTVEYLIPTYAFAPPPEATEYCNKAEDEDDVTLPLPSDLNKPKGGLFETKRRKHQSMERRFTFLKGASASADEAVSDPTPSSSSSSPARLVRNQRQSVIASVPKKKKGWALFVENFVAMFKPKKKGSELLKQSLSATLTRVPEVSTEEQEPEPFTSTLRRSLSGKRRTVQDVMKQDILEREGDQSNETLAFEPLDIPAPNEKQLLEIKGFRMSEKKYANLLSLIALFNGTHNFHNYIPGSVQDDSRCFVNIYNIDASPLEIHHGMEWIRIKVQANAFARDQVRKMMAMLILVTRTNTPRSALGNSFGFSKIDIPDSPEGFQILDEPHYNNYNAEASLTSNKAIVRFGDVDEKVQLFRRSLHSAIFDREAQEMRYESWLRQLDNYSFMYCHFLNARGVFSKPRFFPKRPSSSNGSHIEQDMGAAVAEMLERNGVVSATEE